MKKLNLAHQELKPQRLENGAMDVIVTILMLILFIILLVFILCWAYDASYW
ncbi:MAG: hypothetical protein IPG26_07790 [Coprothermobacter sp.]|nr:hypothetical protein [Coprothermobacter sp.]